MQNKTVLKQAVKIIRGIREPEKIVLFGSRSDGTASPISDINIAILGPGERCMDPQRKFEFTFELAGKLLRLTLLSEGVEANTPRTVFKEADQAKLIADGGGWNDMREDRNKTSHLYDESASLAVYQKIKNRHFSLLRNLRDATEKFSQ